MDGLYVTSILPRSTVFEAVAEYSGKPVYVYERDPRWTRLDAYLEADGFSGHEFCYFMAFCSPWRENNGMAVVTLKNLMLSQKTFDIFKTFKATRMETVQSMVRAQVHEFNLHISAGFDVCRMLQSDLLSANALVRVNLAIQHQPECIDEVFATFAERARLIAQGSPEFLMYCPHALKAVQEGGIDGLGRS